MDRYLKSVVVEDLSRKMVFVGGPRQVGKTTFARGLLAKPMGYLSWDVPKEREMILSRRLPKSELWVFDEFHKYRKWRNYLKGLFDGKAENQKILVTGSARLDWYRFGGDSLQGRYHYHRMHPLSVAELKTEKKDAVDSLMRYGGFPEPFFAASDRFTKRWSREYRARLVRDEVMAVEQLHDLGHLELLMLALPARVGSPLSVNALREELQVSHKTVERWLMAFERTYAIFRLAPFGAPKLRAVKKEQKHYHYDWTLVPDDGPRFENLVASHLLKWVHFLEDSEGEDMELRYFRDTDGREVDFVVTRNRAPVLFLECKLSEQSAAQPLAYLKARFPKVRAVQVSLQGTSPRVTPSGIELLPAQLFLSELV